MKFKNNKKEGFVIFYFISGNKLKGEFKNDILDGIRILYDKDNAIFYKGEYKNNNIEGYGAYIYLNGEKNEGKYKNNIKEGYGILMTKNILINL